MLTALDSLRSIEVPDIEPILCKLGALFKRDRTDWLEVDFSPWGGSAGRKEIFLLLRDAILARQVIRFHYYGSDGRATVRSVEPMKIVFKGQGWYLFGYCRLREDYRLFKFGRMRQIERFWETFVRDQPATFSVDPTGDEGMQEVFLRLPPALAYRVYDEFLPEQVTRDPDGTFLVHTELPAGEWIYSYLLSFGSDAIIEGPPAIRAGVRDYLRRMLGNHLE